MLTKPAALSLFLILLISACTNTTTTPTSPPFTKVAADTTPIRSFTYAGKAYTISAPMVVKFTSGMQELNERFLEEGPDTLRYYQLFSKPTGRVTGYEELVVPRAAIDKAGSYKEGTTLPDGNAYIIYLKSSSGFIQTLHQTDGTTTVNKVSEAELMLRDEKRAAALAQLLGLPK